MIQFLLNDQLVTLDDHSGHRAADQTILEYLRNERGQYGTKEGCASGDCGACTVVIAEKRDDRLHYKSVNSCITFVGALAGRQLITVEHLEQNGKLHHVQQQMVDHHGSQCGFCTPGFIMSLFALEKQVILEQDPPPKSPIKRKQGFASWDLLPEAPTIENYLGGNLCRCTGYQPIINAAKDIVANPKLDQFDAREAQTRERLDIIQSTLVSPDKPKTRHHFHIPKTTSEIHQIYRAHPEARLVVGGTDLALEVTQQGKTLQDIILIDRIRELQTVINNTKKLEVGAAISLSQCSTLLNELYPDIGELLKRFGSRQVRNQGSIGGNIANASPIGDLPPVLMALNARVKMESPVGEGVIEQAIPIDQFFIDYRKTKLQERGLIISVIIPKPELAEDHQQFVKIYKVSKRLDDDISAVCGAFSITLHDNLIVDARCAFGGMAAIPKRATHCETALINQPLSIETMVRAAKMLEQDFTPIDDARASADYRLDVAKNLLIRLQLELTDGADKTLTRVTDYE